MAKKIKSFADKARKGQQKGPNYTMAKYVKSVVSEKTGQYRFQETMLKIPDGMNIDSYLKQLEDEELAIDKVTEEDTAKEEAKEEAVAEARPKNGQPAPDQSGGLAGTQTVEEEPASKENAVAESTEESSEVEKTEVETEAVETSPEEAGSEEDSHPVEKAEETTEHSEEESPLVEDVSDGQVEESPEEENTETEEKDSAEA